jgi:hypothetical protein
MLQFCRKIGKFFVSRGLAAAESSGWDFEFHGCNFLLSKDLGGKATVGDSDSSCLALELHFACGKKGWLMAAGI